MNSITLGMSIITLFSMFKEVGLNIAGGLNIEDLIRIGWTGFKLEENKEIVLNCWRFLIVNKLVLRGRELYSSSKRLRALFVGCIM